MNTDATLERIVLTKTAAVDLVKFSLLGVALAGCGSKDDCEAIPSGEGRVEVGFWDNSDCSGDPIITNSFPTEPDADCYCWPGNSGENSADSYSCNDGDGSFTYVQYNDLECGASDDSPTEKTIYTTDCTQDIPPTLYSRILDYSACE